MILCSKSVVLAINVNDVVILLVKYQSTRGVFVGSNKKQLSLEFEIKGLSAYTNELVKVDLKRTNFRGGEMSFALENADAKTLHIGQKVKFQVNL